MVSISRGEGSTKARQEGGGPVQVRRRGSREARERGDRSEHTPVFKCISAGPGYPTPVEKGYRNLKTRQRVSEKASSDPTDSDQHTHSDDQYTHSDDQYTHSDDQYTHSDHSDSQREASSHRQ